LSASVSAATAASASVTEYLVALALTLAVEVPAYVVVARLLTPVSSRRAVISAIAVNLLTHPVGYAASSVLTSTAGLLGAEVAVTGVEALALAWAWRCPARSAAVWAAAVLANSLSTAAGLVLLTR
jgi:hypothetical protein